MNHARKSAPEALRIGAFILLLGVAMASACNSTSVTPGPDAGSICMPGSTDYCSCADGTLGMETCASDGNSYEACVCDADSGAPDSTIPLDGPSTPDVISFDVPTIDVAMFEDTGVEASVDGPLEDGSFDTGVLDAQGDGGNGLQNGAPWPMFGRAATHQGLSPLLGPQMVSAHWAFLAPGQVVSSPAVALDGTVYVGCNDGNLYALDTSGTEKWRFSISIATPSSPAIGADGTIYIGGDKLYAVNQDGTMKWAFVTGDPIHSSPAVGPDGTIYVRSDSITLWAVTPGGGQRWMFTSGAGGTTTARSSPALAPNGSVFIGDVGGLYALDAFGTMLWSYPVTSDSLTPALASDGTVYIGDRAIDAGGMLKWVASSANVTGTSAALGSDGTVYIGGATGLYALDPATGSTKWLAPTSGAITASPAVASDGTVYVGAADHSLYAFTSFGGQRFAVATLGVIESSPAIGSGGIAYFGDDDAHVYAVGP